MPSTWIAFDRTPPVLTFAYSFGPALATSLAVGIDGGLAVVSPPVNAREACFDELLAYGPVKALVAPNALHHMGLAEWKRRFPEAAVFAPAQSVERVQRKSGVRDIRSLADLGSIAGPNVVFDDMPHYRMGEALVRVATSRGRVWFIADTVFNFERTPGPLPARLLFKLTHSAPGVCMNNIGTAFMVKDKRAMKRWLAAQIAQDPPRFVIPAHGAIIDCEKDGARFRELFER